MASTLTHIVLGAGLGSTYLVHCDYVCGRNKIGKPNWKKYCNKNTGRPDFQINLGIDILNYGIGLDWVGNKRLDYMRTESFLPCDCKRCFFCLNGHTNSIQHAGVKRPIIQFNYGKRARTAKCTEVRVNIGKNS